MNRIMKPVKTLISNLVRTTPFWNNRMNSTQTSFFLYDDHSLSKKTQLYLGVGRGSRGRGKFISTPRTFFTKFKKSLICNFEAKKYILTI